MKAMRLEGDWGLDNLRQVDLPDPEPGPDEVLIGIEAVSINPRDLVMMRGGYGRIGGQPPIIPLCDGAGRIVAVGENVARFVVGDLVCPSYSRTWLYGVAGPNTQRGVPQRREICGQRQSRISSAVHQENTDRQLH